MKTAVLREKNQITFPAEVVEAAGLKVGTIIEFDPSGRWRKLEPPKPDVVDVTDVDPKTLLPRGWKIDAAKIKEAVRLGRERE